MTMYLITAFLLSNALNLQYSFTTVPEIHPANQMPINVKKEQVLLYSTDIIEPEFLTDAHHEYFYNCPHVCYIR